MGTSGGCSSALQCLLQGPGAQLDILQGCKRVWAAGASICLSLLFFFFVLTESETRFTVWKYSCTKVPEFLSWQLHKISSGSVSGRPLSCQRLLQVEGNLSSYCKTKFLICYTDLAHSTQQLTTTSKKIKNISFLKSQQIKKKHLRVVHITSSSYARDFSVLQDWKRILIKWDLGNVLHHCLRTIQSSSGLSLAPD